MTPIYAYCKGCGIAYAWPAQTCTICKTDDYLIEYEYEEKNRDR